MRNNYRAITAKQWCAQHNLDAKQGPGGSRWRWCIANSTGSVRFGYKTRQSARQAAAQLNKG